MNLSRLSLGLLGGGSTLPEAVLESSVDVLEVGHSAGTGGHPSLCLQTPVVAPHLGSRVSTLGTLVLLLVERSVTASSTKGVGFGVTFTERGSTFTHFTC